MVGDCHRPPPPPPPPELIIASVIPSNMNSNNVDAKVDVKKKTEVISDEEVLACLMSDSSLNEASGTKLTEGINMTENYYDLESGDIKKCPVCFYPIRDRVEMNCRGSFLCDICFHNVQSYRKIEQLSTDVVVHKHKVGCISREHKKELKTKMR